MKKSDLVTGDLILTSKGDWVRVYLHTENGDIVSGETWFPLDASYADDDFLFNWKDKDDVYSQFVEVWRPVNNIHFRYDKPNGKDCHKLIWKKDSPEKIRLEEIKKTIGELQEEARTLSEIVRNQ